jgi:uncharacterized membrane protein YfcA
VPRAGAHRSALTEVSDVPNILDALWLLGAASVLAGAVAAVSGFGIGSLLTPLLMLSMPTAHAVAVLAIPHAWASLLVLAGTTELIGRRFPLPETRFWRLAGGLLSGVFGGLVGNQGGIRAAALLGFRLPPRQLVATATASALLVDAARLPIYVLSAGPVIAASARFWIVASIGVTIGTFVGVPVLGRIPESTYRRLVGGLLVLLGLSLFVAAAV